MSNSFDNKDNSIQIEPAQASHADGLERVVRSTFHLACPPESDRQLQSKYIDKNLSAEQFKALIASEQHPAWVAIESGNIVGFVLIDLLSDKLAILSKLYLLESHQGLGIAKKLYEAAYSFFEKSALEVMRLSVYSGNENAKRFYTKRGFQFIRKTQFEMEGEVHHDEIFQLDKSPIVFRKNNMYRKVLLWTMAAIIIVALYNIANPFVHSMSPAKYSDVDYPSIDISKLAVNETFELRTPLSSFFITKTNMAVNVFSIPIINKQYGLLEFEWSRPTALCNALSYEQSYKCLELKGSENCDNYVCAMEWDKAGKYIGDTIFKDRPVPDLRSPAYEIRGNELVILAL